MRVGRMTELSRCTGVPGPSAGLAAGRLAAALGPVFSSVLGTLFGMALPLVLGCSEGTPTPAPGNGSSLESTLAPLPPQALLTPWVAQVGTTSHLRLDTVGIPLDSALKLTLGEGVTVLGATALTDTSADLELAVSADAVPGFRDATLPGDPSSGNSVITLPKLLLIQAGAITLSPASGIPGQYMDVAVALQGITGTPGYTWISFGEGITTELFTLDESGASGVARIRIDSEASPGVRDVALEEGPNRTFLPDGFLVDRGLIAINFTPTEVSQGQTVDFVLTGYGTHFVQGQTRIDAGLGAMIDATNPATFVVESPTRITGKMFVCEAGVPGLHDVTVITALETGPAEVVTRGRAFNVLEVPLGVERARGSFSLTLSLTMRDGTIVPSVGASAAFVASTSSCGSYNGVSCPSSPPLPDVPVFNPPLGCTPVPSTTQYPPTPTYDAGEHVFFEAEGVSIQLDRDIDVDGTIVYNSRSDIPLDDYLWGAVYDVRWTGGEGSMSIPAYTAQDVMPALNAEFYLLAPDLRDTPSLDRYDSIELIWVDEQGQPGAQTFPTGVMSAGMRTIDVDTGLSQGIEMSLMTDDGYAVIPAEMVSQLPVGPGYLQVRAIRPGNTFTIPGSKYGSSTASAVYYTGYFELRE